MEIGVSTASLFKRKFNEDALLTLNEIDARVCEIFLCSYQEYTEDFAKQTITDAEDKRLKDVGLFYKEYNKELVKVQNDLNRFTSQAK